MVTFKKRKIDIVDADISIFITEDPDTFPQSLFDFLFLHTPWEQNYITMYGRTIPEPRLTCWYGDLPYTYSNIHHPARPLTPMLRNLRDEVAQQTESTFNSVLLNFYNDGSQSIGMHSDDEPELGVDPVIASLSLGQERTFVLKHKTKDIDKVTIDLPNGTILLMAGETQRHWKHGVPKVRQSIGPRINLTFRTIKEL